MYGTGLTDLQTAELVVVWFGGGLLVIVFCLLAAAQFNRNNPVNLAYILVDPKLGVVTGASFALFISLLVSSWIMVYLTVTLKLNEGYWVAYLGCWGAVKVLMSKLRGDDHEKPPDTKVG